ncbi:hypothetical protein V8F33_002449 [Rhypophila sp. PSN 637]
MSASPEPLLWVHRCPIGLFCLLLELFFSWRCLSYFHSYRNLQPSTGVFLDICTYLSVQRREQNPCSRKTQEMNVSQELGDSGGEMLCTTLLVCEATRLVTYPPFLLRALSSRVLWFIIWEEKSQESVNLSQT